MFAICVKTGIIFKMRSTSFFHVSVPNIYGTSSSTYLIIFLKVISKVLFFNIAQKLTNLLVQLSIFLIDLFVGTYRLSSHARLEAFVIQTKQTYSSSHFNKPCLTALQIGKVPILRWLALAPVLCSYNAHHEAMQLLQRTYYLVAQL